MRMKSTQKSREAGFTPRRQGNSVVNALRDRKKGMVGGGRTTDKFIYFHKRRGVGRCAKPRPRGTLLEVGSRLSLKRVRAKKRFVGTSSRKIQLPEIKLGSLGKFQP